MHPLLPGAAVTPPITVPVTTILVVDDERFARQVFYRTLSEEGYRVFEAAIAQEAMAVLEQAHRYVSLVLLDVVMPVVDGVELGRRMLERWPSLRLLYMSAYPAGVLAQHGLHDVGVPFLSKPFTRHELLAKIERALAPAARSWVSHRVPATESVPRRPLA
jgi:two-component system cell cycle sensor histidine kinase/response regulator CckA